MDAISKVESKPTVELRDRVTWKAVMRHKVLYLLMLPGIVYLIFNNYLPMFGIVIAFQNYNYSKGVLGSDWIGFENFKYLFGTEAAWEITRNTLAYNAVFIVINLVLAVGVALLLNEVKNKTAARFYQSSILFPFFLSFVIIAYLVYAFLNPVSGVMNAHILKIFGIEPVAWYLESDYWPYIIVLVNAWKNVGYGSVIYISAITGIDPEYYEAARIDGAKTWQQIRYITLPLLVPIITIMTILSIGRIFYSDFGLFYQTPMQSGPLLPVTNTIDTYVYRGLMVLSDIGMSSAATFYQSIVGFLLVLFSNFIVRKVNPENALF